MKKVSIMQAQHNLSKVLRSIRPNERVALTRNKKIVAELTIASESDRPEFPDYASRAGAIWGTEWKGASSHALVDESRGDR